MSHWHFFISSHYLTVSHLLSLTALKSEEFTLSSGSFNWGVYRKMYLVSHWHFVISPYSLRCHTDISLYLPITWLLRICFHWLHWKEKSSLWALAVSNGGVYGKMYLVSHWHVLISSYYLTVSNGLSLTALKSEEFTLSSGSFEWGGYCQMYLVSHWHFLISSYYLTVSNGLSLTALKSKEFTLSSGSFEWGG